MHVSWAQRILVVEDEKVLAQNVRLFLSRRFPDVRVAANGKRVMELLVSFSPDVLVLDYHLPGQNGLQIYAEIVRRRVCPVGCVMVTGYPLEKMAQAAREAGIHYLLGKPFSLAELQRLVEKSAEGVRRISQ
jgi:DNA-binding response OmpR family regulator